jgi:hypothetical protein
MPAILGVGLLRACNRRNRRLEPVDGGFLGFTLVIELTNAAFSGPDENPCQGTGEEDQTQNREPLTAVLHAASHDSR